MLESFANGALAVLGISFLIFMHELGHFLAARYFGVRVETFSIGFGRKIAGFHKDGTDYRLSLIPLGGYVKMAGEYGDTPEDLPLDPGDLTAKPIWQRFIIFSAGVIVNLALAFVVFPIAFALGVPFTTAEVGAVAPGGPAWMAGIRAGDVVESVGGSSVYGFTDVALEVALADPENTILTVRRDGRELNLAVRSERLDGRWDAGLFPAVDPLLAVGPDGPAARAGIHADDRLVSANGLVVGSRHVGRVLSAADVLSRAREAGGPLQLVVEREGTELSFSVEPELRDSPEGRRVLGALPLVRRVAAVRGPAAAADYPLQTGQVLMQMDGAPLLDAEDLLLAAESRTPVLQVLSDGQFHTVNLNRAQCDSLVNGDVAFGTDESQPYVRAMPRGALRAAGLIDGDKLLQIDDQRLPDYSTLLTILRDQGDEVVDHQVAFERAGQRVEVQVRTRPLPLLDDGLDLRAKEIVHDLGFMGSLRAGWDASVNALRTTALTLGKLFTGSVGMENLGGPLSISFITYKSAEWDFAKLLFFLALLSVNLGFINILPVPVLDGGQIVFLLCEKVKGSRLSDRFMQNAQLVGLVAILALMVVVTYNDILRFLQ